METIKNLLTRRSISQLTDPIPSNEQMQLVYQAALRAPDHSWLRPWRFIEVTGDGREKLAKAFINVFKKENEIDKDKEKKISYLPFRAPMIIIIVAEIIDKPNVPRIEQIKYTISSS